WRRGRACSACGWPRTSSSFSPAAEDEAAEREAEPEGADGEAADRDRLAPGRQALPASERLLFVARQRLAAPLLAQGAPGPQHERAAKFLRELGPPVFAVPGNHDIPYRFPARFLTPWAEFERRWEATEPVFSSPELHVVGLNSVRPWRHQSGGLRRPALERAA